MPRTAPLPRPPSTLLVAASLVAATVLAPTALAGEVLLGQRTTVGSLFRGAEATAAADLDGDGDLDLAAIGSVDGEVAWWENAAGDGGSWSRHPIATGFSYACSIAAGDVDGDGDDDVLAGTRANHAPLTWWENVTGDGTSWTEHPITALLDSAYTVELVDMDADGDLDVLQAGPNDPGIRWWDNASGDGSVWTDRPVLDDALLTDVAASVVDLDGDGDLDVVGGVAQGDDLRWWENAAGDGLVWTEHVVDSPYLSNPSVARGADLDGDGDLDILATSTAGYLKLSWFENVAGDASSWIDHDVGYLDGEPTAALAADLDGDGDLDLAGAGGEAKWWENTAGDASSWTEQLLAPSAEDRMGLTAADLDGDGSLDLVAAASAEEAVTLLLNDVGDGSTWAAVDLTPDCGGTRGLAAMDVDGDGDTDVVSTSEEAGSVTWWENATGSGDGWVAHPIATGIGGPYAVAPLDVDGDGDGDLLVSAGEADAVSWWENDAGDGGTWTEHPLAEGYGGPRDVRGGDVDGDGDVDLLAVSEYNDGISWWLNDSGDGSAWTEITVAAEYDGALSAWVDDLDGDGDLDVVGAAAHDNDLRWWENVDGDGTTWAEQSLGDFFNYWTVTRSVSAADVDGDGDLDILGTCMGDHAVSWWDNLLGNGDAWIEQPVSTGFGYAASIRGADLDRDGDTDLIAAGMDDDVGWFENLAGDGSAWDLHFVATDLHFALAAEPVDLDGDGVLDLLASGLGDYWGGPGEIAAWPTLDVDADGDGTFASDDCDDLDPDTYPGATELCDGLDNDCDGEVPADEEDGDGDGWLACGGDCDDADPLVHDGATELCDGVDNDCDGLVPAIETDDDGDGLDECGDGDCDDTDPDVLPGADEVCNGIDDDCDGEVDEGCGDDDDDDDDVTDDDDDLDDDDDDNTGAGGCDSSCDTAASGWRGTTPIGLLVLALLGASRRSRHYSGGASWGQSSPTGTQSPA